MKNKIHILIIGLLFSLSIVLNNTYNNVNKKTVMSLSIFDNSIVSTMKFEKDFENKQIDDEEIYIVESDTLCNRPGSANLLQIIGKVLLIVKIIVPIIIIVLSIISISKVVISADEKDTKDAIGIFIKRVIAGLLIFFIPSIVGLVFNFIGEYNEKYKKDFSNCINCLTSPYDKCNVRSSGAIFDQ